MRFPNQLSALWQIKETGASIFFPTFNVTETSAGTLETAAQTHTQCDDNNKVQYILFNFYVFMK